ncbi:peptidylprolyl isomerase [Intrasporangium oryzae NRRL B-24470]|uniref:Peptidylprolyl isomerase n=1 Tax=Intrasporangium oryzae NRRL B-24470 TaxID=1386089 RepID=W9GB65_9MICO|nr:peptidylprolyl isomerase [Intrasporangium oryzae NRRL B-24470]
MRAAVVLLVAIAVAALVWLAVTFTARGPQPVAAPTTGCASPPPPRTSIPRFSAPGPSAAAAAVGTWGATLHTTCGDVGLELDGTDAPRTVASFVQLARGGYWTDSACNRLTSYLSPTAFLQCGDPTDRRAGDPGYGLAAENVPPGGRYARGTVIMGRGGGLDTTSGEFAIVYRDFTVRPGDPVYPVFGRVLTGMEVVDAIAARGGEDTRPDGRPFRSISIRSIDVARR